MAVSKRSELEMLTVVYIEMVVETTKVGEISEECTIKNENRPFKMHTVKSEKRKGGQGRSNQIGRKTRRVKSQWSERKAKFQEGREGSSQCQVL